jgi:hypothetical protein
MATKFGNRFGNESEGEDKVIMDLNLSTATDFTKSPAHVLSAPTS